MRFLIYLIFFQYLSLSAQIDTVIKVKKFEDSINICSEKFLTSYYRYISSAELMIVEGNYEEAFSLYKKAYVNKNPMFLIDLRNYKELANVLNKKETYFQIDSLLKLFDSIPQNFENKISIEQSRDFYLGLLREDQKDRTEQYKKVDYIYKGESGDYIRFRDSLRYIKFINKVSEVGFPSEFEIGNYANLNPNLILEVLLGHWKSWNFDIYPTILQAVKEGKLRSPNAACIMDNGNMFGLHLSYEMEGIIHNPFYKLTIETIKQYDENRSKFYLDSYFKQVMKYEFEKYTDSKFDFGTLNYSFAKFD